ncbi:DUF3024 domain-containing protein [Cohnella sp. GCM10012308]|uniref:DUF3024 domain-containing protein n=1 Tax=Cohnella sp. GCM10012308 TaxID=3317329 RepID=UPI00360C0E68
MDTFTVCRIEKILEGYIALKVPRNMRSSVRLSYRWDENGVTLTEERPDTAGWQGVSIVQFRRQRSLWQVCAKSSAGEWEAVEVIEPHFDFESQLEHVEADPQGIFWTA